MITQNISHSTYQKETPGSAGETLNKYAQYIHTLCC